MRLLPHLDRTRQHLLVEFVEAKHTGIIPGVLELAPGLAPSPVTRSPPQTPSSGNPCRRPLASGSGLQGSGLKVSLAGSRGLVDVLEQRHGRAARRGGGRRGGGRGAEMGELDAQYGTARRDARDALMQ